MAEMTRFLMRRRLLAEWEGLNEILMEGEFGIVLETQPAKYKIGDGLTVWSELPYVLDNEAIQAMVDALAAGQITAQIGVAPPPNVSLANVDAPGTYHEYGDLVVSTGDLESGFVQFFKKGLVWEKVIKPVPGLAAYATNAKVDKITTKRTYTAQITPSPSYNYLAYVTTEMGEQKSWYFAKSIKTIRSIGVFIFKNLPNGSISQNLRVQVLHKRGSTVTVLASKTILPADLVKFNTTGIVGGFANYELGIDFDAPVTLQIGDGIFTSLQCASKLYPIYGTDNALSSAGEWNNGTSCYRHWEAGTPSTTYSDIPSLPTAEVNYNALHFYNYTESQVDIVDELDELNSKKIELGTKTIAGKNKFNKASMYVVDSGIGTDFSIFSSAGFGRSAPVPVTAGKPHVISGCESLRGLRFEYPNGSVISGIGTISNGTPFTPPEGSVQLRFQINSTVAGNANLVQVEEGIVPTSYEAYYATEYASDLNGLPILPADESETLDFDVLLPKTIFNIVNDTPSGTVPNPRTEGVMTWVQKFIREKKELFINGKSNALQLNKYSNVATVDIDTVNFTLTGSGFLSKLISIVRVSVKRSVLASQFPKIAYLGDSIGESRPRNFVYGLVGAMWSMCKEIATKNRIDNSNTGYDLLVLGKDFISTDTVSYKGQNITIKGGAQSKGGWTAFGWLRHPFRMQLGNKQGAWDLLGLTTSLGRNYVSGEADNKIIATTIYGVNAPIISANSYALLVSETQITNLGTWTGSAPQIAAVQAWIDAVAAGTGAQNEFFDINKTGTNRFSVNKWLAQYQTKANDGLTPLVVGSTAGTKVTNVSAYDICLPTHFKVVLGENDGLFYQDYVQISNDIIEIASAIHAQHAAIHVGIGLTAIPGDMFPDRNPEYSGLFYQDHHNRKFDLYKELTSRFGTWAQQKTNKVYLVPIYHTGTPLSNSFTREVVGEDGPNKTYQVGNDDYNHNGYWHNRIAGVQWYAWIAATYT